MLLNKTILLKDMKNNFLVSRETKLDVIHET
jgi:hypothetical protein